MRDFIENWDLKKDVAVITSFYSILIVLTNFFMILSKWIKTDKEYEKSLSVVKLFRKKPTKKEIAVRHFKEPSTAVKIVNGILALCFIIDLSSYPLIKKMMEKF